MGAGSRGAAADERRTYAGYTATRAEFLRTFGDEHGTVEGGGDVTFTFAAPWVATEQRAVVAVAAGGAAEAAGMREGMMIPAVRVTVKTVDELLATDDRLRADFHSSSEAVKRRFRADWAADPHAVLELWKGKGYLGAEGVRLARFCDPRLLLTSAVGRHAYRPRPWARTRKGAKVLRCRECQQQWKLRAGVPRCIPFLHGECTLEGSTHTVHARSRGGLLEGSECAFLHVHKRKEGLDDRVRRFGADCAAAPRPQHGDDGHSTKDEAHTMEEEGGDRARPTARPVFDLAASGAPLQQPAAPEGYFWVLRNGESPS
eukprot:gene14299-61109_t